MPDPSMLSVRAMPRALVLLASIGLCGSLAAGAQDAERLSGTYVGSVSQLKPANGAMAISSHLELYRFLADGRYCTGFTPEQDLATLNWDAQQQATPKLCGYYEIAGLTLRLMSIDGATVTLTITRSGEALNIAGSLFVKLQTGNEGTLVGSFWRQGDDTASAGAAPAPSAAQGLAFFADGRFESLGAGAAAGAGRAAGGQYELHRYRLVLRYADGRQASWPFFRYPYDSRMVVIDGNLYQRH